MIRRMQRADIDRVADIWLDTNIRAHNFISKQYWQNNFSIVKEMLSQSEIYVYFGKLVKKKYIGDGLREIEYEDIKRANRLMYITAFLCELLSVAVMSLVLILL